MASFSVSLQSKRIFQVMKQRPIAKEEDVLKDLSLHFCPCNPDPTKKTLFWLPASDEIIEQSEVAFAQSGYPAVAPNSDFFALFPEYWTKYVNQDSPTRQDNAKR